MGQRRRGGMTAGELIAELEGDPEYQRKMADDAAARDDEERLLLEAEKPLVADLAAIGIETDSAWNLYKISDSRPKAFPVLIEHLGRPYPDKVLEGIGQALDHRSARPWWAELKAMYVSTSSDTIRDRLGSVLATIAAREHYDELVELLADESLGTTRIYLVRAVNRIGNRIAPGQGRRVVEQLVDDPTLGPEARQVVARRSRNA